MIANQIAPTDFLSGDEYKNLAAVFQVDRLQAYTHARSPALRIVEIDYVGQPVLAAAVVTMLNEAFYTRQQKAFTGVDCLNDRVYLTMAAGADGAPAFVAAMENLSVQVADIHNRIGIDRYNETCARMERLMADRTGSAGRPCP